MADYLMLFVLPLLIYFLRNIDHDTFPGEQVDNHCCCCRQSQGTKSMYRIYALVVSVVFSSLIYPVLHFIGNFYPPTMLLM